MFDLSLMVWLMFYLSLMVWLMFYLSLMVWLLFGLRMLQGLLQGVCFPALNPLVSKVIKLVLLRALLKGL